jgi:hypothetical protein
MSHANGNWNGRKTLLGKTNEVGEKAKIRVNLGQLQLSGESGKGRGEKSDDQIRLCSHDAGFGCASRGFFLGFLSDPCKCKGWWRPASCTYEWADADFVWFFFPCFPRQSRLRRGEYQMGEKQIFRLCDGLLHIPDCFSHHSPKTCEVFKGRRNSKDRDGVSNPWTMDGSTPLPRLLRTYVHCLAETAVWPTRPLRTRENLFSRAKKPAVKGMDRQAGNCCGAPTPLSGSDLI